MTSVISTTLIWPKAKLDLMGSSQIVDAAATASASQNRRTHSGPGSQRVEGRTSRLLSRRNTETISNARFTQVITMLAVGIPSQAKGQNTMAANGG